MHSIISIVGIILAGKENYPEWSRMIKHTLIFNELWKGVCVRDEDNEPVQPTLDKELVIWENKNNKAYELIVASINEEVSHHISPFLNSFIVESLSSLDKELSTFLALLVKVLSGSGKKQLKNKDKLVKLMQQPNGEYIVSLVREIVILH